MRLRLITNLTGTLLVAGMASMAYAWAPAGHSAVSVRESIDNPATAVATQQDQEKPKQDETKPPKENRKEKAPKAQQTKPKHQDKANKEQPHEEQPHEQKAQEKQPARDQRQPNQAHQDHGRANGGHARIPDRDFHAHFGRDHHFAVRQVIQTTRIVPNQTQFVYGGYTFIFLDPWPDDWNPNDDCYIDYEGDQYVLIDLDHPGTQIALSVVIG